MVITDPFGNRRIIENLTEEQAAEETKKALADPNVENIEIYRMHTNRHQRRKDAAEARKYGYGPNYRGEWK
jgi:hypothetical protein